MLTKFPDRIRFAVGDDGVGIFDKIQRDFGLHDKRHALLELSKGKLTSDKDFHSGEGIFFSSRMFDLFSILSGDLLYAVTLEEGEWLMETEDQASAPGTYVVMEIAYDSERSREDVFAEFSSGKHDYAFSRTHVPIRLARYGNEQLLSRSQAKRVLARFDQFREVLLDFEGVETIGQAFADEIFRIFQRQHPDVELFTTNTTVAVESVINHVTAAVQKGE